MQMPMLSTSSCKKLIIFVIEDDGPGMPPEVVGGAWLEPGSDFKTRQVNDLKVSDKYSRLTISEKT